MIRFFLITLLSSLTACGWIYTDTIEPYCIDMEGTPVEGEGKRLSLKSVSVPRVPGARAMWSSNAIGEIAAAHGIERVHYCDRHKFSVVGGLWYRDEIVLYGEERVAEHD